MTQSDALTAPQGRLAGFLTYEVRLVIAVAFAIVAEAVIRLTTHEDVPAGGGLHVLHVVLRWVYIAGLLVAPFSARPIITIAQRELTAYFTSPLAYVVIVFFLFFSGLIFTFMVYSPQATAEIRGLLGSMVFLTLMVSPFLTMSLLAQERASGTIELLLTKPVRDREVVLGKYLAALGIYAIMLLLTFQFPLLLKKYGEMDFGPVWVGYLGLLLAGGAFLAIGLFASSMTRSQMASAGICLGAFLFFWLIGWVSMVGAPESLFSEITKRISVLEVFTDFEKGLLDAKNVIYFVSLSCFFLFMTIRVLEVKRQV